MTKKASQPKAFSYIRFSSPEQETGDSIRRQVELSEEYARQHGLTLDNSLRLTDRGLSAYRGVHRTKGALGEFLRLVEAGEIPEGSILLVENLDRLSREQVLDALNQFTGIIQAGIRVVTLQDGIEYDRESINQNWTQLIISIVYMARAHEESEAKSKRVAAAWANKRKNGTDKKLTGMSPAWLRLEGNVFNLIPEVADAVRLIYEKRLQGKGAISIEREMNENPHVWKPPKSGRNGTGGWRKSYIDKILRSRAVIGEFQAHVKVGGKRQPVGSAIPNYFPPVISDELFYQVQELLQAAVKLSNPDKHPGGYPGKANSLFTYTAKCGLCGGSLHFMSKGKHKGGWLTCDTARRLKTCNAKPVRYHEFEELFFANFEELDISQLIPEEDEIQARLNELKKKLTVYRQKLLEIDGEVENFSDSIGRTQDSRIREQLEKRLSQAFDTRELLEAASKELEHEITRSRQQKSNLEEGIRQATEVYRLLDIAQDEDKRIELRLRLRQQIQRAIEWIKIYPLQEPYQEVQETEEPGIVKIMRSRYIDKVRIEVSGKQEPADTVSKEAWGAN